MENINGGLQGIAGRTISAEYPPERQDDGEFMSTIAARR
tara:strand:- start:501 stop:617 length:117 start_codon:yes stop_codon:yes gene_type:complete